MCASIDRRGFLSAHFNAQATFWLIPLQGSSIAWSPPCEDTLQASTPYATTNPTVVDLPDALAFRHDHAEDPRYRCMDDTHPENDRPTFKSEKELKRHERAHNPNAKRWYCGCCQNLGDTFKGKTRKDKVQDHLRRIHESKSEGTPNLGTRCPEEDCLTLFTAASCLDEHMRQVHPDYPWDKTDQKLNGE